MAGEERQERGLGGAQVEGRQAVRELLLAGVRRPKAIFLAEGNDDSPILAEIIELAEEAKVPVREVTRDRLAEMARTETPQGVVAFAQPLKDHIVDTLLEHRAGQPVPFLLACDGITDPQNLGSLLRSADAAGITGVVLPSHRSVHVTPTVAKAAAGAIERLPMATVPGLPSFLLQAKDRGAWVIGLDADAPSTIYDYANLATDPVILVVGAEGDGLSRLVRERCHVLASIPSKGALASLNAAVAGAIAMVEIGRHRANPGTPAPAAGSPSAAAPAAEA
jgi:23S rRNA (guanosine2251-2'-O)-methyltransferase